MKVEFASASSIATDQGVNELAVGVRHGLATSRQNEGQVIQALRFVEKSFDRVDQSLVAASSGHRKMKLSVRQQELEWRIWICALECHSAGRIK
jgi:hypothetical protein